MLVFVTSQLFAYRCLYCSSRLLSISAVLSYFFENREKQVEKDSAKGDCNGQARQDNIGPADLVLLTLVGLIKLLFLRDIG